MSAKRSLPLWITLFFLFNVGSLVADDNLRVAVMDFQNYTHRHELVYLEKAIPEILVTDLSLCDKIILVERARLQEILDEMQLALSGVIDDDQVVEIGKMASANAILVGSIVAGGDVYRLDARLVDVASGEVILAEKKDWLSDNEIIRGVDELAEQIIRNLTGESIDISPEFEYKPLSVYDDNVLTMETALDQPVWLNGSGNAVYLQVDIYSKEVPQRDRIPLNLALVIDRSGSMAAERKLDYVKNSAKFIVQNMSDDDIVSLVTYESNVDVVVPAQPARSRRKIISLIDNISSGGSTNLSGGMLEGYSQVRKYLKTGQVNRVLLLSDGLANEGVTQPDKLMEICYEKSKDGLSISTFGVGADFDEDLLQGLADLGTGNYYYIHSPEEIPTIFASEMSGLLAVAAQNVKVRLKTAQGVTVDDVIGYLSSTKDQQTEVAVGDIFSNDHYSITFKLDLPKTIPDSLMLARVFLNYDDVVHKGDRIQSNLAVYIKSTSSPENRDYYRNPYVGERLSLLNASKQLEKVVSGANESNLSDVQQSLAKQAVAVANSAREFKSTDLKKKILTIHRYSQQFAEVEKKAAAYNKYSTGSRSTTSPAYEIQSMKKAAKYDTYQMEKKDNIRVRIFQKPEEDTDRDSLNTRPEPDLNPVPIRPVPAPKPIPRHNNNLQMQEKSQPETIDTRKSTPKIKPVPKPPKVKKLKSRETKRVRPNSKKKKKPDTKTRKEKQPVKKPSIESSNQKSLENKDSKTD